MCHDHFGFYLAWGSAAFLPTAYTLQTQYLARNPVDLSPSSVAVILTLGFGGYAIFRSANDQKYSFRSSGGDCVIWGKQASYISCPYKTKNGDSHTSTLLCSGRNSFLRCENGLIIQTGWWGTVRHANYLGDLALSYSMCAACGFGSLLPWTYAFFMTILLVHRCHRDERRCSAKYGPSWDTYCARVPWRMIPGIF